MSTFNQVYQQMALLVEYFIEHQSAQPTLSELAKYAGLSEAHLQKIFSQWVGVSPKQFLKFLTKEQAKKRLRESSVMNTALEVGLSGSGRLHDLMVTCEGVTPGQFKQYGKGLEIEYGVGESPFGNCFLAKTEKGVCKLAFFDDEFQYQSLLTELNADWPNAVLIESQSNASRWVQFIFAREGGQKQNSQQPLHLIMKGSPFQLKVWQALLEIPQGELSSYQQVAEKIGQPSASRAVASAIAKNDIGFLIPCHRVIRSSGEFNQYRWGATRKSVMIGWEASRESL